MEKTEEQKAFDVGELRNGCGHHFYFLHPITGLRRCQFYYRTSDGVLYQTIGKDYEECVDLCRAWLRRIGYI